MYETSRRCGGSRQRSRVSHFFTPAAGTQSSARLRTVGGSYGLAKAHLSGNTSIDGRHGFLSASFLRFDGYRDHSAAQRLTLLGTAQVDIDPHTQLRFVFTGLDTIAAQDPGALTAQEVRDDRRQARPGTVLLDTGEEVLQGRLGTVLEHRSTLGELSAYGFAAYRDVASLLPAQGGAIGLHRIAAGGGVAGSTHVAWLIPAHRLSGGIDVQYQRDARRRFTNEQGTRGELSLDQLEEVRNVGPFLRYAALLHEQIEVSAGIRYDHFDFDVDGSSSGGDRSLDAWSPGGGVRYSPLQWLTAFADVGTAFQVPTTTELANPAGPGFNPNLDPQTATSTEAGVRVSRSVFDASATGFIIDVRDVLVPFEIAAQPGRTFYRNAGRAQRVGLELEAHAEPLAHMFATTAFTVIDARFVGDDPDTRRGDDRREPGVPPMRLYGELAYRPTRGFGGALELHWIDDSYVDDANTAKTPEAVVCNLRMTYRRTWQGWTLLAGAGLNNMLNDRYDGRVRVNAQGGRYFEPAARFNAYGTIELAWSAG